MPDAAENKRARRKARHQNKEVTSTISQYAYDFACHILRIGLYTIQKDVTQRATP